MIKRSVKRFESLSRVILLFSSCFLFLSLSFARGNIGIHDGTDAAQDQFPWFVAIGETNKFIDKNWPFCGGVLVGPQWVLTAQHCLKKYNPINLKVMLNSVNLERLSENVEVISVDEIYRYDESEKDFESPREDLALLHLSFPVANIEPIPLLDHPPKVGEELIAMGYGVTDMTSTVRPVTLQYAEVRVVPNACCKAYLPISFRPFQELCTVPVEDAYPLYGDSGGPLIQLKNGTYYLAGIIIRISSSVNDVSVYSSIGFPDHYIWISAKIK